MYIREIYKELLCGTYIDTKSFLDTNTKGGFVPDVERIFHVLISFELFLFFYVLCTSQI